MFIEHMYRMYSVHVFDRSYLSSPALRYALMTLISCGAVKSLCMVPHARATRFNILQHSACGGKPLCHTPSTNAAQTEHQKQTPTVAILWCRKKRHTHIKKEAPTGLRYFF
jgi:hypothetical protein